MTSCTRSHRVRAVSGTASACRTVVVGTDGPGSSLPAVARAGALAGAAGAREVAGPAVQDSPVEALLDAVRREDADLLAVGKQGLDGIEGGLPVSGPADATRRSQRDVLVARTTD